MFNFFKKSEQKEIVKEKNNILASISYIVDESGQIIVDVSVNDYDKKSMDSLFEILDTLSQDKCYVETVNIIKDSLIRDNQEEFVLQLVQHLTKQTQLKYNKLTATYENIINTQPCIKPSEMLK